MSRSYARSTIMHAVDGCCSSLKACEGLGVLRAHLAEEREVVRAGHVALAHDEHLRGLDGTWISNVQHIRCDHRVHELAVAA